MPSQPPPWTPALHARVPSHSNDAIIRLAEAIIRARYALKGEPMPVVWMLSETERTEALRAAVRCVRGLDEPVRAVAVRKGTTPPLPSFGDEQRLRDVALMRFAIETYEAHLEGLTTG